MLYEPKHIQIMKCGTIFSIKVGGTYTYKWAHLASHFEGVCVRSFLFSRKNIHILRCPSHGIFTWKFILVFYEIAGNS